MARWSSLQKQWVALDEYTHGVSDNVSLATVPAGQWTPLPRSERVPNPHVVGLHADEETSAAKLRKAGPVIEVYSDTSLTNLRAELTG